MTFGERGEWALPLPAKLLIVCAAVLFGYWCFLDQSPALAHPFDAYAYTHIGNLYLEQGVTNHLWAEYRTYAYPLFLSGIFRVADAFGIDRALGVFAVQMLQYVGCVVLLSRSVARHVSRAVGELVFVALMLNVWIYPVLAISLTDGVSVCLLMLIAHGVLGLAFEDAKASRLAALGFLCGLAILVRPANVILLALLLMSLAYVLIVFRQPLATRLQWVLWCAAGFGLVVAPQVHFNVSHFGKWTFLPAFDLGHFQIDAGIEMIKYATNLSGGSPKVPYPNPFATPNTDGVYWYVLRPVNGLATAFLHLFAALDFDYLSVYIFDKQPWYRPLLFVWSQSVNFWGSAGILIWLKSGWLASAAGPDRQRHLYLGSMALLFMLGWAAVTSVSAVENRFAIPVVTLLLPFALWSVWTGKHRLSLFGLPLKAWFLGYLAFAAAVSWYVGGLKTFIAA